MGTITLPNFRTTADVTMNTRLKDGGVYIDWAGLTDIKAWIFSDAQKALAGRVEVTVNQEDSTNALMVYSGTKPQYPGVNRLIVQARYHGSLKTYDKPVFNFVPRTADQAGTALVIDDPEVNVEIEVTDTSSSILDTILAACIKATEEAREVVDVQRGPRGYSAYQIAVQNGYEGTEEEWLESLVGDDGKSAYELAVQEGYVGTLSEWLASLVGPQGKSAYQVAVDNGFEGTQAQWLASLVGPQGLSAYQVAVAQGYTGTVNEWLASLVGPVGPTPVFTVGEVTTGQPGTPVIVTITGTPANPVLNITIPQGLQGNTGSSVAYPFELVNNEETNDATKAHTAAGAKRLNDKISQLAAEVHNLSGKYYGLFTSSSNLPEGDTPGYAFVGSEAPFAIWNFDGEEWADTGATIDSVQGEPGTDGVGFASVESPDPADGTVIITLSNGDKITLDLNHNHPAYYSKVLGGAQPVGGFEPDVVYSLGTLSGAITFSLASPVTGNVNHYFWMFDTSSTAPTITWPAGLTWAAGAAPTVAASKHYEISILGGVAYYSEV